ncbi:gliding motility-associated C-terminal domain-containing protein [Myroides odoratus]|uniref:gliding motility-associated C-terminal domain-containing protein n=1 Tax=Myroides odoratus TaxID=256 RepID=UPI0039B0099F
MRYFVCIAVFFCFYINALYGQQNLVINPSFEDVNVDQLQCNLYQSYEAFSNAIQYWNSPFGTSDIYNINFPERCSYQGVQRPRTGSTMLGFVTYINQEVIGGRDPNTFPNSEFIEGQLITPLLPGHTYRIKFYVMLAVWSHFKANNFGIQFFQNKYVETVDIIPEGNPDANYTTVVNDSQNWHLVQLEFTPQIADLKYFIIGNFFNGLNTTAELTAPFEMAMFAYYYIDDVSIIDLTPSFQPIGPFCKGAIFTLPEESQNGHIGTWSPAINNQQTTTYTFTPDNPELQKVTLTVEIIEPYIEPIFDLETTVCKGTTFTLPGVSENGIKGTWSPEVNNQKTTTYTFTPEVGSCGLKTRVMIEVVDVLTPEFTLPSFICAGSPLVLPELSNNGISGIWTPAIDNQQTTTYTFTPVGHDCTVPIKATVEVKRIGTPLLNSYCTKNGLYVEVVNPDLTNQFQWQINDITIEELSPLVNLSRYANLLRETQNRITVSMTNIFGCISTNTIEIENKNLCLIPKGISPQGDGFNDTFDLSHFGGVSLQIFNRYGMKVYDKKNYRNEWFGQTNSSNTLLPSGTYFYQIVTNQGEMLSGWVQLVY